MKKCFIYQDEKSQKYWNIEILGLKVIVNYGRIGTDGQTKEKAFTTDADCLKEFEKLISQKTKKGYVETTMEDISSSKVEAKRYALSYGDIYENDKGIDDLIKRMSKDEKASDYKHITIGFWGEAYISCQPIIDYFIENKEKYKNLETLFIGDIEQDECEVSWIGQGNYSKLWDAFPNLEKITIKGSDGLNLGNINHTNLKKITIISGGLPTGIFESIKNSNLPNLEELCLYLGDEGYGYELSEEELEEFIMSLETKTNLKKLALVNSELQDLVVKYVLNTNYVKNLISLDFSYGTLGDRGVDLIIEQLPSLPNLKSLLIEFHFISEETQELLRKKCKEYDIQLTLEDCEDPDTEYYYDEEDGKYYFEDRYVMISE